MWPIALNTSGKARITRSGHDIPSIAKQKDLSSSDESPDGYVCLNGPKEAHRIAWAIYRPVAAIVRLSVSITIHVRFPTGLFLQFATVRCRPPINMMERSPHGRTECRSRPPRVSPPFATATPRRLRAVQPRRYRQQRIAAAAVPVRFRPAAVTRSHQSLGIPEVGNPRQVFCLVTRVPPSVSVTSILICIANRLAKVLANRNVDRSHVMQNNSRRIARRGYKRDSSRQRAAALRPSPEHVRQV